MALQLEQALDNGVSVTYFRILEFTLRRDCDLLQVTLGAYLSKAVRDAGKQPVFVRDERFVGESNPLTIAALSQANPYALIYAALKLRPEFAEANDV